MHTTTDTAGCGSGHCQCAGQAPAPLTPVATINGIALHEPGLPPPGEAALRELAWAELLRQRFDKACARLGLNRERIELDLTRFRRPAAAAAQASLF